MKLGSALLLLLVSATVARAQGTSPAANGQALAENTKDEPTAKEFSLARATEFLDAAALAWQEKQGCFSCHTNYAYLYARPLVKAKAAAHGTVRKALEELVSVRWAEKGPRWPAEVVASAAALAFNDAHTTGKLHPLTKAALDRMWTLQRPDGGWDWLKCSWPPMEIDDHYGVTLAALAVGFAPENYAKQPAAQEGLEKMRGYLRKTPPQNLHHLSMVLWVATYAEGFMTAEQKKATIQELRAWQRPDGGWNSASLGNWTRRDKAPQDVQTSDGYATGFVIYVLRRAGVPATDPALQQGIAWLKANQRESGRWFTRSLYRDNRHYLSHAGTAFAVMALAECDAAR